MFAEFHYDLKDNVLNIKQNVVVNHYSGECRVSPDKKYAYINIPKNASSSASRMFKRVNWAKDNFHNLDHNVQYIVILRDPTDRWITGVAQFLARNMVKSIEDFDNLVAQGYLEYWLFNFIHLDEHTVPQLYFLQGLDKSRCTFFYQDPMVLERINTMLNLNADTTLTYNVSDTCPIKTHIISWLTNKVTGDPKLQKLIDMGFWADHQLLDQIEFYS